jgi:hypothetical protein
MNRTRRIVATVVATAALAAPTTLTMSAADAEPHSTTGAKPQAKQLLKDIAGKDKRLARLATSHSVTALADDTEAALVANVTEARDTLAVLRTTVEAADSAVDTRAVRKELHGFRTENLRQVVTVLKHVDALSDDAAADPEATALLTAAETAALAVTPTSPKADVKAAKALVHAAEAELGLDDADEDASTD